MLPVISFFFLFHLAPLLKSRFGFYIFHISRAGPHPCCYRRTPLVSRLMTAVFHIRYKRCLPHKVLAFPHFRGMPSDRNAHDRIMHARLPDLHPVPCQAFYYILNVLRDCQFPLWIDLVRLSLATGVACLCAHHFVYSLLGGRHSSIGESGHFAPQHKHLVPPLRLASSELPQPTHHHPIGLSRFNFLSALLAR